MRSDRRFWGRRHRLVHGLALLSFCLLQACASPSGKLNKLAGSLGLERSQLETGGYELLVYKNPQAVDLSRSRAKRRGILHVYLEGDGSPWIHRAIIMADPTPRHPLMLNLMALDRQPAAYLGRPCYNGTSDDKGCDNGLWTSGRYSRTVVDSMASGLRVLARRAGARELWLIGHSGGGSLAMLLAHENPMVTRVVTIAGNLDPDAWTSHHGYSPLYASINPAHLPPLRDDVWQWHLLGGQDAVIPPPLVRGFIMAQPQASGFLVKQFSHGCCWKLLWPRVLNALERNNPRLVPGRQFKFRDARLEALGSP